MRRMRTTGMRIAPSITSLPRRANHPKRKARKAGRTIDVRTGQSPRARPVLVTYVVTVARKRRVYKLPPEEVQYVPIHSGSTKAPVERVDYLQKEVMALS